MVKILGIDPSLTATGIAIVSKEPQSRPVWEDTWAINPPMKGHERLEYIANKVLGAVRKLNDGDIIVMEGPSFGSGGAKSHELAGGWWIVKHAIWDYLMEDDLKIKAFYVIPPRSRAKYATGNGNAKKHAVIESVVAQTGMYITDHNIADAIVLATMGARLGGAAVDKLAADELHKAAPLVNVKNQLENGLSSF